MSKSVVLADATEAKVSADSDITGDGKPDILLFEPQTMKVRWLTSESGCMSYSPAIVVGGPRTILPQIPRVPIPHIIYEYDYSD